MMTRKRYVKLLMAQGFDRNTANTLAWWAVAKYRSYSEAYRSQPLTFGGLRPIDPDVLADAMARVAETVGKMVRALSEGIVAFSKAYQAAMANE